MPDGRTDNSNVIPGNFNPPVVEKIPAQFLQGKLTYAGLIVALLAHFMGKAGLTLSPEQSSGLTGWIAENWDSLVAIAAAGVAAFGRWRREMRFPAMQIHTTFTPSGVKIEKM